MRGSVDVMDLEVVSTWAGAWIAARRSQIVPPFEKIKMMRLEQAVGTDSTRSPVRARASTFGGNSRNSENEDYRGIYEVAHLAAGRK